MPATKALLYGFIVAKRDEVCMRCFNLVEMGMGLFKSTTSRKYICLKCWDKKK